MANSLFSKDLLCKRTRHTVTDRSDEPQQSLYSKKRFTVDCTKKQHKWSSLYGELADTTHDGKVKTLLAKAHTPKGCRNVQTELMQSSPDLMEALVLTVACNIPQLMTHKYANYLCQTLFQQASCPQRLHLLNYMRRLMPMLAKDTHGTHSMQALVSVMSLPEEEAVLQEELGPHIVELSRHPTATHVVQKMLVYLTDTSFIVARVTEHCLDLATEQTGLNVIKRCLSLDCTLKSGLIKALEDNCVLLCQDPFGNYVIQHLLDCVGATPRLCGLFREKIMALSTQKFSSNVVEKVLLSADAPTVATLLSELAQPHRLTALLQSLYGCFVLRSAARVADSSFQNLLSEQTKQAQMEPNVRLGGRWAAILEEMRPRGAPS
jgi:hypothetical protein